MGGVVIAMRAPASIEEVSAELVRRLRSDQPMSLHERAAIALLLDTLATAAEVADRADQRTHPDSFAAGVLLSVLDRRQCLLAELLPDADGPR